LTGASRSSVLVPDMKFGEITAWVEAVPVPGSQPTSAAGRALTTVSGVLDKVEAVIEDVAVATSKAISRSAGRAADPAEVEVEFGLKVSTKGDVIVAGVSGGASLKVKLTYKNERKP